MEKTKLLVVAHPDDETIFFGGLVQSSPGDFHIICVTDGNADGRGQERQEEFETACKELGADTFEMWDFPDIYEKRLDTQRLSQKLQTAGKNMPLIQEIYTHNPLGEYGHPHHQDVCWTVYQTFPKERIHTPAYNNFSTGSVELDEAQFQKKAKILTQVYGKETQRFLNILPITHSEGFAKVAKAEVDSIYQFLTNQSQSLELDSFQHMEEFIKSKLRNQKRLF